MHALRLSLVVGIAAVALLATSATAQADPGNGATVINDVGCFMSEPGVPAAFTTDSHTVITPSGDAISICHFDSTNPTGKAIVLRDFGCNSPGGVSSNSQYTLSPSGQGTLICLINVN